MIRVFLTDDHELYLKGLALVLDHMEGFKVVGTASTANALLNQMGKLDVDILLMDVHLPDMDEEELLIKLRALYPTQKIAYLTLLRGTKYVHKLHRHGIQGYMLKNISIEELQQALLNIHAGDTWFAREIDLSGLEQQNKNTITMDGDDISEMISKREIQVLKLICREYSNLEIAEQLGLTVSTIETHRKNLISKLGVQNSVGLVRFAYKYKIIE